jgi:hypothetical protein
LRSLIAKTRNLDWNRVFLWFTYSGGDSQLHPSMQAKLKLLRRNNQIVKRFDEVIRVRVSRIQKAINNVGDIFVYYTNLQALSDQGLAAIVTSLHSPILQRNPTHVKRQTCHAISS